MFTSCEKNEPVEGKEVNISQDFSKATSEFAFDFWKTLDKEEPATKNYFVSPLSLHMALGMLLNGADKDTKTQIQKVLGLQNQDLAEINQTYLNLIENLPLVDPKVINTIANSVWQEKTFTVEKAFLENLSTNFKARLYSEDFGNPATVNKLNQWAADNTNQKIKQILDKIDPGMVMFLVNALYFKGDWTKEFKTKDTKKDDFMGLAKTSNVDMMHQKEAFPYFEDENLQIVELPYGNEKYSMKVILPKNNISEVIKNMSATNLQSLEKSMVKRTVIVGLPKFKLEYSKKLNNVLKSMGMDLAFTDKADLSKIAKPAGALKVGFVKQDTYVAVDEKGTEAAAVTTIGIELTSVPVYPEIVCNKPFVFLITEKTSNTVMFVGKIVDL
jgi:serpin B